MGKLTPAQKKKYEATKAEFNAKPIADYQCVYDEKMKYFKALYKSEKEASDCNVDMTAIGFLYRYGYFTQTLSPEGQQIANYEAQNFQNLPIEQVKNEDGSFMVIDVPYPDRLVHAYLWRVAVGRINLYLLDTDNELNSEWDRSITHQLYGGDWENRIKQEIMLGIGGVLGVRNAQVADVD